MTLRTKTAVGLAFLLPIALSARAGQERTYELVGRVVQNSGKLPPRITLFVSLHSVQTPFTVGTIASGGAFKFKNLRQGTYSLTVTIPLAGETSRTIEIGPSLADSKGRILTTVSIERKLQPSARMVSAAELSVSGKAKSEYSKAQNCLNKHDTACAVAHLKKAVEISPRFSAALNHLGTIAYQARNYAEAEQYFRQALEQDSSAYAPLVNLGGALISTGKPLEALSYNLQAVKTRPEDALAQAQLGQSYYLLGQPEPAEAALRKAKALDPGHFSYPQLILAQIYIQKQDVAWAVQELEEFLKLHPDSQQAPRIRKLLQDLRRKRPLDYSAPSQQKVQSLSLGRPIALTRSSSF